MSQPTAPSSTSERRVVTVLFADLVGSTELAAGRDPEQMRRGLALVFERVSGVLRSHGGTVEKFIGDAVMAVFGLPEAHDDDPERAIRAGLALHRLGAEVTPEVGFPVAFRIAVNTGEVAAGSGAERDLLVTGVPVNVGARLYSAAEPGWVLAGELTKSLTESQVRFAAPIEIEAKGAGALKAWRVESLLEAEPGAAPRGIPGLSASLVGRDAELALLQARLVAVREECRPHLVTVIGEPGVGKSRLLREFAASSQVEVGLGRCLPYGEAGDYHAMRSLLASIAAIAADDPAPVAATKLRARVGRDVEPEGASITDRLLVLGGFAEPGTVLTGIAGDDHAIELRWAFRQLISRASAGGPLVLAFEDVHWAPSAMLDLIEDSAARATGPILICCLARPELTEVRPGWGSQGAHASTIRLSPLAVEASQELVSELLKISDLPHQLVAEICDRAGGNPLYVEEILRALIAAGHLRPSAEGWQAASRVPPSEVPDSLRGVITARLDRLGAPARRLLQRGSVFGRYFALRDVRELTPDALALTEAVQEALRSDFLITTDEAPSPTGARYHFRHALIRDAVYGSIPKHERQLLHGRAAGWLERDQAERGEDLGELVAHHLEQAFRLAAELQDPDRERIGRRAYDALIAVATRHRRIRAHSAALPYYERAEGIAAEVGIPLAERKDEVAWQACARHLPKHGDADQSELFAALELVRRLGPTTGLAQLLGFAAHHAGSEGPALAAEALEIARATGDPESVGWSLWFSRAVMDPNDHERNWTLLEETLEIARRHDVRDLLARVLTAMAERAQNEGSLTRARALQEEAYANASASGAKVAIADAATFLALGHGLVHDREAMVRYIDEAIAAARELSAVALPEVLWLASWGEFQNGLLDRARDHGEESLRVSDPAVWPASTFAAHFNLALVYAARGELEPARAHEQALTPLLSQGRPDHTRSVHRLIAAGFVAAAEGRPEEAERSYREALMEMDRSDAQLLWGYMQWDLQRVLLSERLGDLLASQGRTSEARAQLADALAFWSDPLAWRRREELEAKLAALARA